VSTSSRKARKAGSRGKGRKTSSVQRVSKPDGPAPKSLEDLFGGGDSGDLLQGRYHTDKVYAWFQRRHAKGLRLLDPDGYYRRDEHEWKVPYGVRYALTQRLLPTQISNKYPWMVTWRSPRTGKRLYKKFTSLPHAIVFVAERAQYVDARATILCRHHMDIPPGLRNKIPKPWKWCPRCMKPRKYKRVYKSTGDPETFYGTVKTWVTTKYDKKSKKYQGYYTYPERKLALTRCNVCGCTNRDQKFRRSNQPFHKTTIKKGKTRVKRGKR
jgi:hypothetical protein